MADEQWTTGREESESRFSPFARRLISWGIIALIVLGIALIIFGVRRGWTYREVEVVSSNEQEDTLSVTYCNVDGNILRYGAEGASLRDRKERTLWTVSYRMQSPAVCTRGDTVAIYDTGGTGIVVCNEKGQIGTISADLPIRRADVSDAGNVATIQDDGNNTWIQYYSATGEPIATIKTAIDDPGYPMDLALSDDGETLVASYLSYRGSAQKSLIHFYSFSQSGQGQRDNRIAEFEYTDQIIPEVDWFDGNSCVVFREGGFTIYQNSRIPEQRAEVQIDGEIQSVFHDETHIGLIVRDEEVGGLHLQVYDRRGALAMEETLPREYRRVELVDNEVTLYRGVDMLVYNLSGVKKFEGSYAGTVRQMLSIGRQRYLVVTENGIRIVKLK